MSVSTAYLTVAQIWDTLYTYTYTSYITGICVPTVYCDNYIVSAIHYNIRCCYPNDN